MSHPMESTGNGGLGTSGDSGGNEDNNNEAPDTQVNVNKRNDEAQKTTNRNTDLKTRRDINRYSYLYGALDARGSSGTSSSQNHHPHQNHPQTVPLASIRAKADSKEVISNKNEVWDPVIQNGAITNFAQAATIARVAGVSYLFIIIFAMFSEAFVRSAVIVDNDPQKTAKNIRDNIFLFKTGFVADICAFICDILVNGALYLLLKVAQDTE